MTVEPNRFAGPLEEAMLRESISAEEADLDRVHERLRGAHQRLREAQLAFAAAQEAMDTASAIVAQTEAHAATLMRSLSRSRGLLHPIRRLPSEVLAMIFLRRLDEVTDTTDYEYTELCSVPFWMASVCRKWRSVALGTPFLWAHIAIDFDRVQARVQPWHEYLLHCMRYSAQVALSLRIITAAEGDDSLPVGQIWAQLLNALRRSRSLRVNCQNINYPRFRRFIKNDGLQLEFCDIQCYNSPLPMAGAVPILPIAPCLRRLHVAEVEIDWSVGKRCDGLRKLTYILTGTVFASDFAMAATRFPNITDLELFVFLDAPTPTSITFAYLRSIRIGMTVNTNAAQAFHLPALEEASIDVLSSAFTALMLRTSLARSPKLRKLAIHSVGANAEIFDAIAVHTNLVELSFHACYVMDEFCRRFARTGPSVHWPCPRLSALHIKDIRPSAQRITFDGAALLDLVRARRSSPSSDEANTLRDVVVTWESGADYSVAGFHNELARIML